MAHFLARILFGLALVELVRADSVTLPAVADTTLFAFSPNNNLGAEDELILGSVAKNSPNNRARLLIRFDLSGIPAGATITNVSFHLSVLKERSGQPPETVGLHRLLVSWAEGTGSGKQGSAAAAGQSTWNSRAHNQPATAWGSPGGLAGTDFSTTASSTHSFDGPATYTVPSTPGLIADVQNWLTNPEINFGWILVNVNESVASSARRVRSRESTSSTPQLTIDYQLPPPPQIVNFDSLQVGPGGLELRFRALAGNIYSVWHRETLSVPAWQTLTNVISKLTDVDAVVVDPTVNGSRFYQLAITGQVD